MMPPAPAQASGLEDPVCLALLARRAIRDSAAPRAEAPDLRVVGVNCLRGGTLASPAELAICFGFSDWPFFFGSMRPRPALSVMPERSIFSVHLFFLVDGRTPAGRSTCRRASTCFFFLGGPQGPCAATTSAPRASRPTTTKRVME